MDGNSVVLDGRWASAWYQVVRPANPDSGSPDEDTEDDNLDEDGSADVDLVAPDKGGCGCSTGAFSPASVPWLLGLMVAACRRNRKQ